MWQEIMIDHQRPEDNSGYYPPAVQTVGAAGAVAGPGSSRECSQEIAGQMRSERAGQFR